MYNSYDRLDCGKIDRALSGRSLRRKFRKGRAKENKAKREALGLPKRLPKGKNKKGARRRIRKLLKEQEEKEKEKNNQVEDKQLYSNDLEPPSSSVSTTAPSTRNKVNLSVILSFFICSNFNYFCTYYYIQELIIHFFLFKESAMEG